jgi:DmX-like protein
MFSCIMVNLKIIQNLEHRWMKLRKIDLQTADGLPALPMQISWVRDGILVIGMDSEMHVYSQWKPTCNNSNNDKNFKA